jgi:hypothetical protein
MVECYGLRKLFVDNVESTGLRLTHKEKIYSNFWTVKFEANIQGYSLIVISKGKFT